ncbi:MAG TPA: NUDIX hydrolase, partial [Micromonosporaceae bacterium]
MRNTDSENNAYDPRAFDPVAVTVDIVALTIRADRLHVLLVERGEEPYAGRQALPGGFVRQETLDAGALRELAEETGLHPGRGVLERVHLEQLGTYGDPDRDPRMRVVSVAYLALAPDLPAPTAGGDAAAAHWAPVAEVLPELFPNA